MCHGLLVPTQINMRSQARSWTASTSTSAASATAVLSLSLSLCLSVCLSRSNLTLCMRLTTAGARTVASASRARDNVHDSAMLCDVNAFGYAGEHRSMPTPSCEIDHQQTTIRRNNNQELSCHSAPKH